MRRIIFRTVLLMITSLVSCCSQPAADNMPDGQPVYSIYIMNRNIHTGLIIPVNNISKRTISALAYFEEAGFVDFGWGDEVVYQAPHETFCMDLRAVTVPSSSVMRVEVFPGEPETLAAWSGYTVAFRLTEEQFRRLCAYIDSSFTRDVSARIIQTSTRSRGEIIYFKSVHTYCGLNTCNTWVADALNSCGLDVSSFFIITESSLYNEVKKTGVVLKSRD